MGDQREKTRAARRRGLLPAGPAREAFMGGAAIVVIGALMAVVSGMTVLAVIIAGPILVIFAARVTLNRQAAARVVRAQPYPPERVQPTADDLDAPARALLRRAVAAIDAVISSQVCQDGLVDRAAISRFLTGQRQDIAAALRELARLRAGRAELPASAVGPMTAEVRGRLTDAAQLAESSVAGRIAALERYAAEIREADAAYRDWQQAARLTELHSQHLDMLARTAADQHGIADIEALSLQARAVRLALSELPG